jgi:hypothetical protein
VLLAVVVTLNSITFSFDQPKRSPEQAPSRGRQLLREHQGSMMSFTDASTTADQAERLFKREETGYVG